MNNCPICNNELVTVLSKKEIVSIVNGIKWTREHSNYWCPTCEINLVDYGKLRPDSYPKLTSTRVNLMLDSIRGV